MSCTHKQSLGKERGEMRKKKWKGEEKKKRSRNTLPACQELCGCSACLGYIQLGGREKKELHHVCTASGECNGVRQIKWEKNDTDFGQQPCIPASVCVSLCVCEDSAVTWSCWHNATSVLKECSGYPCIPAVKSQSLKLCVFETEGQGNHIIPAIELIFTSRWDLIYYVMAVIYLSSDSNTAFWKSIYRKFLKTFYLMNSQNIKNRLINIIINIIVIKVALVYIYIYILNCLFFFFNYLLFFMFNKAKSKIFFEVLKKRELRSVFTCILKVLFQSGYSNIVFLNVM